MKTNHTQGKWEAIFERYPDNPKIIYTGVGINSRVDGGVYTEFICNSILPDDDAEYIKQHDEIEANMKLIAAAPEMLKAMQNFIDNVIENPKLYANQIAYYKGIFNEAIKKATE